jgi:hypothetical protein
MAKDLETSDTSVATATLAREAAEGCNWLGRHKAVSGAKLYAETCSA